MMENDMKACIFVGDRFITSYIYVLNMFLMCVDVFTCAGMYFIGAREL